jgi:hypothetical protein
VSDDRLLAEKFPISWGNDDALRETPIGPVIKRERNL